MIIALFMFVLQIALFLVGVFFIVSCYSSGYVYKDTLIGYPYKIYTLPWYNWVGLIFLMVSWLWLFIFLNNLADYINSAIICEDYFKAKEGFRGFWGAVCNSLIYHMGSVAWASIILLPCSLIQFIYGPIYDMITKTGDEAGKANWFQKCMSKVCCCIKIPYQKFIMRVGEQGFPMGYIASCNFVPAAKEAYYLLLTFGETLGDIPLVNNLYRLTAVLAISFMNTFIAFLFLNYLPYYKERLHGDVIVPLVVPFLHQDHFPAHAGSLGHLHERARHCVRRRPDLLPDRHGKLCLRQDVGHYPRDALLNQFMIDQATKLAKDERMAEFVAAGGKNMGSKYEYIEPEY